MSSRRVILDSDDEEEDDRNAGCRYSPEKVGAIVRELDAVSSIGDSSADPAVLQALYVEHFGEGLGHSNSSIGLQSPILERPIVNSRMPSSTCSARKLKRSKTTSLSSLTSISEPTASRRKAKRIKSLRDIDDLTQVTTPGESKDITQLDLWEFPSSNTSDRLSDLSGATKSGNTKKNKPIKTYGRSVRRSQTMAHTTSSQSKDDRPVLPTDGSLSSKSLERLTRSSSADGILPLLPSTNRLPEGIQLKTDLKEGVSGDSVRKLGGTFMDWTSTSTDTTANHVRTTRIDQQPDNRSKPFNSNSLGSGVSILSFQAAEDNIEINEPENLSVAQKSRVYQSSIAVVPNLLTDDQRRQYDVISVTSSPRGPRSSLAQVVSAIDRDVKGAEDSCMALNSNSQPLPSSIPAHNPPSPVFSPSPAVIKMTQKRKRAKSDMGLDTAPSTDPLASTTRKTKRKGRSKTIAPGEKLSVRDTSMDELSLMVQESVTGRPAKRRSTADRRKRISELEEEEYLTEDDVLVFDPNTLQRVHTQLRSGMRKPKSIIKHSFHDNIDDEPASSLSVQKKVSISAKFFDPSVLGTMEEPTGTDLQLRITQLDPAAIQPVVENSELEVPTQEVENSLAKTIYGVENPAKMSVNELLPCTTPTVPPPTKRRRRKKTSETAAGTAPLADSASGLHDVPEKEKRVLEERDCNSQGQYRKSISSITAEIDETVAQHTPLKTAPTISLTAESPTRNPEKDTGQHSPLQSGRVPYRIGLSKRTRIAPLLKMIRK